MATVDPNQPDLTPVGDVPAAINRAKNARVGQAMAVPAANASQTLSANPISADPSVRPLSTGTPAGLPRPADFVADARGNVQANTASAAWKSAPGAQRSFFPSQPVSTAANRLSAAPNWTTAPGVQDANNMLGPQATRATSIPASPTAGASLSPATAPAEDISSSFAQRTAAARGAVDAGGAPRTFTPGQTAAANEALSAARSAQSSATAIPAGATEAATDLGTVGAKATLASRLVPGLTRAAPIVGGALAIRNIGNAAQDARNRTYLTTGDQAAADEAAKQAALTETGNQAGGLAGATLGAQLGAQLPGGLPGKIAGTVGGALIGGTLGTDAVKALSGSGSSGAGISDLPAGVYQMNARDDVPHLNASGTIAPTPYNTDVASLQSSPTQANKAAFDAKFGKGMADYYLGQTVRGVTPQNSTVSAIPSPASASGPVTFMNPAQARLTQPPGNPAVAMNSTTPGTAVINGHVLTPAEIADAGNRLNTVPSTAFTNPSTGVLFSAAGGGLAPTSAQALAMNANPANERKFGTDMFGNPIGTSGAGIGGPNGGAGSDRQATIAKLMGQISDQLAQGKRGNARVLIDQLQAYNQASGQDQSLNQQMALAQLERQPRLLTPAQQALEQAQAEGEQMSVAQRGRLNAIEQAIATATNPDERRTLQQEALVLQGKEPQNAASRLMTLDIPVGQGVDQKNLKLPYDPVTGQLIVPKGYTELLQSLQASQAQAPK